jgi:hypothetical protein
MWIRHEPDNAPADSHTQYLLVLNPTSTDRPSIVVGHRKRGSWKVPGIDMTDRVIVYFQPIEIEPVDSILNNCRLSQRTGLETQEGLSLLNLSSGTVIGIEGGMEAFDQAYDQMRKRIWDLEKER